MSDLESRVRRLERLSAEQANMDLFPAAQRHYEATGELPQDNPALRALLMLFGRSFEEVEARHEPTKPPEKA